MVAPGPEPRARSLAGGRVAMGHQDRAQWAPLPTGRTLVGPSPMQGPCPRPAAAQPITAKNVDIRKLAGDEDARAPWHFKLLMVLLALYLIWRIVDLFL